MAEIGSQKVPNWVETNQPVLSIILFQGGRN